MEDVPNTFEPYVLLLLKIKLFNITYWIDNIPVMGNRCTRSWGIIVTTTINWMLAWWLVNMVVLIGILIRQSIEVIIHFGFDFIIGIHVRIQLIIQRDNCLTHILDFYFCLSTVTKSLVIQISIVHLNSAPSIREIQIIQPNLICLQGILEDFQSKNNF